MKVLKEGRAQRGWSKEATCTGAGNGNGGCGAKLLVEEGDLYETRSHHYDGSSESYVTFRCSACGVETDMGSVPSRVRSKLVYKTQRELGNG